VTAQTWYLTWGLSLMLGARLTKGAKQPNDWEQGWNGYGLTLLIDVMASLLVVPESLGLSVFISECP